MHCASRRRPTAPRMAPSTKTRRVARAYYESLWSCGYRHGRFSLITKAKEEQLRKLVACLLLSVWFGLRLAA